MAFLEKLGRGKDIRRARDAAVNVNDATPYGPLHETIEVQNVKIEVRQAHADARIYGMLKHSAPLAN